MLQEVSQDARALIESVRALLAKSPDPRLAEAAKKASDQEIGKVITLAEPRSMALRLSQGRWLPAKHLDYLSRAIHDAVKTPGGGRLIISMPRRMGKSELTSHWTPAWFLSTWPSYKVILTSYETTYAEEWGGKVRDTLLQWSQFLGVTLKGDTTAKGHWSTGQGGEMYAVGAGGALMGRGAHLFVVDDPYKSWEEAQSETIREKVWEWYQASVMAGLEPNGTIIILHTRWHPEDLIGRVLDSPGAARWKYIKLSAKAQEGDPIGRAKGEALWPARQPQHVIDEIEENIDERMWASLYQQDPGIIEGDLIKRSWWRYYSPLSLPPLQPSSGARWERLIQSWDTTFKGASTSDWVVGQVWGLWRGQLYLLAQTRKKMGFTDTCDAIREMSRAYPESNPKLIEQSANGWAIIETLQHEIKGIQPVGTKGQSKLVRLVGESDERASAVSVMIKKGLARLPDPGADALGCIPDPLKPSLGWVREFVDECSAFTGVGDGVDDQVDAMTQALRFMQAHTWVPKREEPRPLTLLESRQREMAEWLAAQRRGQAEEQGGRYDYFNAHLSL